MDATRPSRVVALDPSFNRTYHYWHAFVPGITEGQIYAYRVHGPNNPERGLRFDPRHLLLDPYGRAIVTPSGYDRATVNAGDASRAMKSVLVNPTAYDWEDDAHPQYECTSWMSAWPP